MGQTSKILQVDLPRPFPTVQYDEARQLLAEAYKNGIASEAQAALTAVAFRYRATHESQRIFTGSLHVAKQDAPTEELYVQEQNLASFFFNAMSCLESMAYAIHATVGLEHPAQFPLSTDSDRRKVSFKTLASKLAAAETPWKRFGAVLVEIGDSSQYADLDNFRRILFHRAHPSRLLIVNSRGKLQSARVHPGWFGTREQRVSPFPMDIAPEFLDSRRSWLDRTVKFLLHEYRAIVLLLPKTKLTVAP